MNWIEKRFLLKSRDVTNLHEEKIDAAVLRTGGDPTNEELSKLRHNAMMYYKNCWLEEYNNSRMLAKERDSLKEDSELLTFLKKEGVEKWKGYKKAVKKLEIFHEEQEHKRKW